MMVRHKCSCSQEVVIQVRHDDAEDDRMFARTEVETFRQKHAECYRLMVTAMKNADPRSKR